MFTVSDFEKEWKDNKSCDKGVVIFVPGENIFVCANMGTGDNLLSEDIAAGYDDYIYVESYEFNCGSFEEVDGSELLFNTKKDDYYDNLAHFCEAALDSLGILKTDYAILQMY